MGVPICGPRLSLCCMLLSIWGIIMLGFLGIFFFIRAPALVEDIGIKEEEWGKLGHSYNYIEDLYFKTAVNCWIASGLYCAVLVISFIMWRVNKRSDYTMS